MSHILDSTDKAILNLLQDDATLPLKTVAERVHVSVATAQRRIQALIDSGVITKQVAIVNGDDRNGALQHINAAPV